MLSAKFTIIFFLLITLKIDCFTILRESGCPDATDVEPCNCYNNPYTVLECQNLSNADDLKLIFENSVRYTYREVHILYSALQYFPHDMFDKTPIKNLHLKNVTLENLFDSPPNKLHMLDNLYIENVRILSGTTWNLLKPLTELRLLTIYFNSIRTLNSNFSQYVNKRLEQITFYSTDTREIDSGVLTEFKNLTKVQMDACKLTELSRDMFPTPFNVKILYFNGNRITTIPEDLFTQMPNLQTLGLRNNLISVIPEAAFEGNIAKIENVWFNGNPLKCDCLLQWIVGNKPTDLRGNCNSPKRIYGKELKDLSQSDFRC